MKTGSCAGVDGRAIAGQALEDLFGAFGPHERTRVLVPGLDPGVDVGGQLFDVAMRGALELLGRERGEPALDEVHPRTVGRGEVEMEAAVPQQPAVHEWGLVGSEVVEDHVYVELGGHLSVHLVQEGNEVGAGVGLADVADHRARRHVEGGEEVTGAVALVVVGGASRRGGQHGQSRGGAVERLDLGLLVDGEHSGGHRRAHVEPNQVADLLDEVGVRRHLEGVLAPGFEPEGPPDLSHRRVADLVLGRQGARRPVRGIFGCALERLDHDRFDHVVADGACGSGTGRVDEAVEALGDETLTPLGHRRRVTAQVARHLRLGAVPNGAGQHDLGSQRQRLRRRMAPCPAFQCGAFVGAQVDLDSGASSLTIAFLRCWRTTPDQRGPTEKIPVQPRFLGASTFQDTSRSPRSTPEMAASEQEREPVEDSHDDQQEVEAGDEGEVFERTSEDCSEQIGAEGGGQRGHVLEPLGEHEVGDKDRREGQRCGGQEARHHRQGEQRALRDDVGDRESGEEDSVEQDRPWESDMASRFDRGIDGDQDPDEDERVDVPGGAEEQGELHDVLRFEQQEGRPHEEQIDEAGHAPERSAGRPHDHEGEGEDEHQDGQVVAGDGGRRQVRERAVVRDRRHRRCRSTGSCSWASGHRGPLSGLPVADRPTCPRVAGTVVCRRPRRGSSRTY